MDPEQTFIRVQERFSQMLTPRVRAFLEYMHLFVAASLFCILVVMHANYVQQPGCSSQLYTAEAVDAQLIQVKISSTGLWSQKEPKTSLVNVPDASNIAEEEKASTVLGEEPQFIVAKYWWNLVGSGTRRGKAAFKLWKTTNDENSVSKGQNSKSGKQAVKDSQINLSILTKKYYKAATSSVLRKWQRRFLLLWGHTTQAFGDFQKFWNIAVMHLNFNFPWWLRVLHSEKIFLGAVQWLDRRVMAYEPMYLYTKEKGYLLLPEGAKVTHNIRTLNISISARHPCFGNRWQQLLINRVVGYDTILMNSLINVPGQGYLYNYQTKEFFNLSFTQESHGGSLRFGDYLVTKCGVLMMSLFVFFTTTMSVSFTLRETQTRMLKFTVQLQHHARHRLPTFQLIFVHVFESLVFVPIMIGILFFLFEFYDDQLLAFMVLVLVWLCELFTLISVRTPISMKFFPRFFLLYFLVFHIYFFSYAYGFTYLALATTAAFMQHLILYFWNRFEVPALQRFLQNRRSHQQQQPNFHFTSTILASTLHITRLSGRNTGQADTDATVGDASRDPPPASVTEGQAQQQGSNNIPGGAGNPIQNSGRRDLQGTGPSAGGMNSFSSLLLWILGGSAYSEGLSSLLSIFREGRDRGQGNTEPPLEGLNTGSQ